MASDAHCPTLFNVRPIHLDQTSKAILPKTILSQFAGPMTKRLSETSTTVDKPAALNKQSGMTFTALIHCVSVCVAAACKNTSSLSLTPQICRRNGTNCSITDDGEEITVSMLYYRDSDH